MYEDLYNLRKNYFLSVLNSSSKEEIISLLPIPAQANYYSLINGIIKYLNHEISEYNKLLSKEKDSTSIKDLEEIKNELLYKIKIIEEYRDSFNKDIEEDVNIPEKVHIIFGMNPYGNNSFFEDLKKIDREYYEDIEKMLVNIQNGVDSNNPTKIRRLIDDLAGVMEAKTFKIRIHFRMIDKNTIYLMMVRIKKDDNSIKDKQEPRKRASLLLKDFERVKNLYKTGQIDEIYDKSIQDMEEIMDYIEENKIAKNKGKGKY